MDQVLNVRGEPVSGLFFCPTCDGSGIVTKLDTKPADEEYETCIDCDGSGVVRPVQKN